jgi:putative PIN family toxin of toxin-antitoxin system
VTRAVVDTNILIRAVIKPLGTVGPVVVRLRASEYKLIYSKKLLDELIAKLALPRIRQKYDVNDETVEDILALIALRGEMVEPTRKVKVCRDPKDDMVIEAALAGEAQYIVTGDEDLLALKEFESIEILIPKSFLEELDKAKAAE